MRRGIANCQRRKLAIGAGEERRGGEGVGGREGGVWFKSDISGTEDIGNIQEIYRNIQAIFILLWYVFNTVYTVKSRMATRTSVVLN